MRFSYLIRIHTVTFLPFRAYNTDNQLIIDTNCDSLEWVYIPDTIIEMGSGVFDKCDNLKEIRIPKGSRAKFEKLLPFSVDKVVGG